MKEKIITEIRQALKNSTDKKTLESSNRVFKEGEAAKVYGVRIGEVGKIGRDFYRQIRELSKKEIFAICEELWKSKYLEEAVIACVFSESLHKKYEPSDFKVFERWVRKYVNNWADCDTLCNHTIGTFLMMYPEYVKELKKWAKSSGRWVKRASAVTLIIPARKGLFLKDILEIADILLLDKDDLVQKGYGWMLKAASLSEPIAKESEKTKREHLKAVFDYVMKHKAVMPRTALRYAIEKMPPALKAKAMKK
ncbi:MAG: DNA alkylation repair protein [Bacteroidales bacterium]|nr:DNA alkylation repair protein [Bacteroidales bacterium]